MVRYDGDSSPILVAGGGIGGLITAFALARLGFAVRVFEQAPEFREVGAGIQLGPNIFRAVDKIGLKQALLADAWQPGALEMRCALSGRQVTRVPLDQRFTYDPQQNIFFVNFERFSVRSRGEIRAIVNAVENKLTSLGHRVYAIVNYDNFFILPELLDEYSAAVRGLVDRFYSGVSRYTTSGFLRIKLGEALEKRGVAPHIFESAAEAQSDLRTFERDTPE